MLNRIAIQAAASMLALAMLAVPALAATTVHVSLTDDGQDAALASGMGMAMDADMSKAIMHVVSDTAEVPAGDVTFEVANMSAAMVHEMIVAKVADTAVQLPYDAKTDRIDEDAAKALGEVSELDAGKTGSLTLTLEPGTYMLFCNLRGHYMAGMWTMLTVK